MAYTIEEVGKKLKNPYIIGAVVGGGVLLLFFSLSRKQAQVEEDISFESYPTPSPEMTYPQGGGATITPDVTTLLSELQTQQAQQMEAIGEMFAGTMTEIMAGFSAISEQMREINTSTAENIREISKAVSKSAKERQKESQSAEVRVADIEKELSRSDDIAKAILEAKQTYIEAEKRYLAGDKSALKVMEESHKKAKTIRESFGVKEDDPLLGNDPKTYIGSYKGNMYR